MPLPPGPLLIFALNVLSGVVAFLTSYYSFRFSKVAESPLINSLTVGFMLLGVGLIAEAGTSVLLGMTLIDVLGARVLALVETFAYLSIQMLAYLVFALGYAYLTFGKSTKMVAMGGVLAVVVRAVDFAGLYRYALVSYFVVFVLLAFVVFQGILIHSRTKSRFSALVLLAFSLILAAHAVLLASVAVLPTAGPLSGLLFLVGTTVQFFGFVSLLAFLLRSGRVGAG